METQDTGGFVPSSDFIKEFLLLVQVLDKRNLAGNCGYYIYTDGVLVTDFENADQSYGAYPTSNLITWEDIAETDSERTLRILEAQRVFKEAENKRKLEREALAVSAKEAKDKRDYARLKKKFENQKPA